VHLLAAQLLQPRGDSVDSLDPPEHCFIHNPHAVQVFALRLCAGRVDIKSRHELGEFEATAYMRAFIRVVPDAKDTIAGNIDTLYHLPSSCTAVQSCCSSVAPCERCRWSTCKLFVTVWSVLRCIKTIFPCCTQHRNVVLYDCWMPALVNGLCACCVWLTIY
jgi:hypothetical protein